MLPHATVEYGIEGAVVKPEWGDKATCGMDIESDSARHEHVVMATARGAVRTVWQCLILEKLVAGGRRVLDIATVAHTGHKIRQPDL